MAYITHKKFQTDKEQHSPLPAYRQTAFGDHKNTTITSQQKTKKVFFEQSPC